MAPPRKRPDDATLREWFEAGWTYQQMADHWATESGIELSGMAFMNACKKARDEEGELWFKPRQMRHAGTDLLPWTNIRPEHMDMYEIAMLRRESLRRHGHTFPNHEKEIQRLNAWLQGLRDDDAVIAYKRDTQQGWWRVRRKHTDLDIVRLPAGYKRQATP